uniref:Uncharacterized protein n=1 Tax=Anguilla anguilla TaxID=7936 RepID=A0A0E9W8X7_ANGAN
MYLYSKKKSNVIYLIQKCSYAKSGYRLNFSPQSYIHCRTLKMAPYITS